MVQLYWIYLSFCCYNLSHIICSKFTKHKNILQNTKIYSWTYYIRLLRSRRLHTILMLQSFLWRVIDIQIPMHRKSLTANLANSQTLCLTKKTGQSLYWKMIEVTEGKPLKRQYDYWSHHCKQIFGTKFDK